MPALFLWAAKGEDGQTGNRRDYNYRITRWTSGVYCSWYSLRNALIVKEDGKIPYPRELHVPGVFIAGEEGRSKCI